MRHPRSVATILLLVAALCAPRAARACGGCFIPPGQSTVVTGHRMAMSVSTSRAVLWDQIQYSGEPEDFAWVLPVKPGARLEASTSAFFEILEYVTAVRVASPPIGCGTDGCGATNASFGDFRTGVAENASADDGGDSTHAEQDPVQVVHQGTVGPYETVTLSTDQPGALNAWLDDHGYNVDDASQPIIDQYVAEGFDFIALRLLPGKGVREMTPVRVVFDGSNLTLPLRMVAIGTGPLTPIVLYVIGEGRYRAKGFDEATIVDELLSWDFEKKESNYADLRDLALSANEGARFLTAYSQPGTLTGAAGDETTGPMLFPQRYGTQAYANGETMTPCAPVPSILANDVVVNPCPPGEPWTSAACGTVEPGQIDARTLGCTGVDDVAAALEGLHVMDARVTRLEANLSREALLSDLVLEASTDQGIVAPERQARIAIHPEAACESGAPLILGRDRTGRPPSDSIAALATAAALLSLAARLLARSVPRSKPA